jgi:alcohol dehydrogenase class IV
MIRPFNLASVPEIIFAPGSLSRLAEKILFYGNRPLIVLGRNSFCSSLHYQRLIEDLLRFNIHHSQVHIEAEPSPQSVNEIIDTFSEQNIDLVLAIGGGSTVDAGKAISAMLVEKRDITVFLEGVGSEQPTGAKLPFIAVPTTSGTGSEASSNAVISAVGKEGFKKSLRHNNYIPDLALIDPTLSLSCSPQLTAACGMDCFTQLVEAYLSTRSSSFTDALAIDGIRAIERSLKNVCSDGSDLQARSDLSYAALLSGIVLGSAGLGTVHGFASVIGGFFDIPHGVVCGTLMAPANRITLKRLREKSSAHPSLEKYAKLGKIFSSQKDRSPQWYQDHFIEVLYELSDTLGIPGLREFAITEENLSGIVSRTTNKNNPVDLDSDDLTEILEARLV